MWGIASNMSNAMIKGLAQYFASQKPAPGTPQSPALVAAGKKIFDEGDPKQGIPACKACHGAVGQGMGTFPRLAGQHRDYILEQLVAFQTNTRSNVVMHANVQNMTHDEMEEIAAYLASL
jgi:cytochrome c553